MKTKIDAFGQNAKHHIWIKLDTTHHLAQSIPTAKYGHDSIVMGIYISAVQTGRLVRIKEKINWSKYRDILE